MSGSDGSDLRRSAALFALLDSDVGSGKLAGPVLAGAATAAVGTGELFTGVTLGTSA